jgi:hypothetical protein
VRALSIRQPYAELILRGIKTIEYRSRPTRIVGERFHIYASKTPAQRPIWSRDLSLGQPPAWMLELGEQVGMIRADALLPSGVIVGSAVIDRVTSTPDGLYAWHLKDVERDPTPRPPRRHPQPVWFNPF